MLFATFNKYFFCSVVEPFTNVEDNISTHFRYSRRASGKCCSFSEYAAIIVIILLSFQLNGTLDCRFDMLTFCYILTHRESRGITVVRYSQTFIATE